MTLNKFRDEYKAMMERCHTELPDINELIHKRNQHRRRLTLLAAAILLVASMTLVMVDEPSNSTRYLDLEASISSDYYGGSVTNLLGQYAGKVYYIVSNGDEQIIRAYDLINETATTIDLAAFSTALISDKYLIYGNSEQTGRIMIRNLDDGHTTSLWLSDETTVLNDLLVCGDRLMITFTAADKSFLLNYDLSSGTSAVTKTTENHRYFIAGDEQALVYLEADELLVRNVLTGGENTIASTVKSYFYQNENLNDHGFFLNGGSLNIIDVQTASLLSYDLDNGSISTVFEFDGLDLDALSHWYYQEATDQLYLAVSTAAGGSAIYRIDIASQKTTVIAEIDQGRVWDILVNDDNCLLLVDDGVIAVAY